MPRQSGFYLLSDNANAFVARFALATIAENTLDIQYYIIHNDASGQYLGYAILAAADRGVKVRILVDDINLSGRDSRLKMLSQHKNIQIRIFNPLHNRKLFRNIELVFNHNKAGRRMHNKVFIADDATAIIGGRNIGDEYFDARKKFNFVDLDLLTIGPIVKNITTSFNDYWNSHWSTPIENLSKVQVATEQLTNIRRKLKDRWHRAKNTHYFQSLKHADLTQKIISKNIPFIWAQANFFYDKPEKLSQNKDGKAIRFVSNITPYFQHAKKELLFASPYFVPKRSGALWIVKKRKQGVQIKVLTNSLAATDVVAVHTGYKRYRLPLLRSGVQLFELKPSAHHPMLRFIKRSNKTSNASLHAKYMILDQRHVFIGSANLDPRSDMLNTEVGIMIDSKALAQQTIQLFNWTTSADNSYRVSYSKITRKLYWQSRENGQNITYNSEPKASFLRKLKVFILGLLPIEDLL